MRSTRNVVRDCQDSRDRFWRRLGPAVLFTLAAGSGLAETRATLRGTPHPPLAFEEVRDDGGEGARFLSRGPDRSLTLGPDGAVLTLRPREGVPARAFGMSFPSASRTPQISGVEALPGMIYHVTPGSLGTLTGAVSFRRVHYAGLYPGIDLVFYGNDRELEFDFVVAPGEDVSRPRLAFSGADTMTLEPNGELVFGLGDHEVRLRKPNLYQERAGRREPVAGGYRVVDAGRQEVAFAVEDYDRARPLVIDPTIDFATYRGGDEEDFASAIEVNALGETYLLAGAMDAATVFPSSGLNQTVPLATPQPGFPACFLTKMSYDGAEALYTVVFEGAGCQSMALAPEEPFRRPKVHLQVGTSYHYQRTLTEEVGGSLTLERLQGSYDACQLGSCGPVSWMRTDGSGNVYFVMSYTPTSLTPPDFVHELRKIDPQGQLVDAVELVRPPIYVESGANFVRDQITGFDLDEGGRAYVVGVAFSPNLIAPSSGAFQSTKPSGLGCTDPVFGACLDGFLLVLDAESGSLGIRYATYLGGTADDRPSGVAYDATSRRVLVTGTSSSSNFPTTPGSFLPIAPGLQPRASAFVVALDPEAFGAQQLVFGTFLSAGSASPTAITLLAGGMPAIVGGATDRVCSGWDCFPLQNTFYPRRFTDAFRPFLSVLSADGALVPFSTFLDDAQGANSFAADVTSAGSGSGTVYVAMTTDDASLGTAGAVQPFRRGPYDALVQAIDVSDIVPFNDPPEITFTPSTLELTVVTPATGAHLPLVCGRLFDCDLEEPDGDLLTHLVWLGPDGFRAESPGTLPAPAAAPGIFPIAFASPGVGTHEFTLLARDERGAIGTATLTVEVSGENTFPGVTEPVVLTDARFVADNDRPLGAEHPLEIAFSDVTSPGLTWLESRSDLMPAPPPGLQAGSPPYYYDLHSTAATSGEFRLCFNVRGMSFARPDEELLVYESLGGGAWFPLDNQGASGQEQLCGDGSGLGTFAIFYPQVPPTAITTFAGTGCAEGSIDGPGGDPCDDFGLQVPAVQSTLTRPVSVAVSVFGQPQVYVTDNGSFRGSRVQRIDPLSGIVSLAVPEGVCDGFGPIATDPQNDLILYCTAWNATNGDRSILGYDLATGTPTTIASSLAGEVRALAFDWQGNLFFADGRVHRVRGDGPELVLSSNSSSGFHQVPYDDRFVTLDFDAEGALVAGGTTLVRITPGADGLIDGSPDEGVRKIGGAPLDVYPGEPFGGDGLPASDAGLTFTYQLLVAGDGAVVFTDQSSRIRRIDPGADGVVNGGADEIVGTIAGYFSSTLASASDFATSEWGDFRGVVEDPRAPGYFIVSSHQRHELKRFGLPDGNAPSPDADLSVAMSASATTVATGAELTLLISIRNGGPGAATGVFLNMPVAGGFAIAGVDAPSGVCTFPVFGLPGTMSCSFTPALPPGATLDVSVHVTPSAPGIFTSVATVGSVSSDPFPSNNVSGASVTVAAATDLLISVVPSRTLVNAGDAVSYGVTIANHGPLTATAVQFSMPAPQGVVIDNVELPPLSCLFVFGLGSVSCAIADLPSGQSVQFAVNAHATTGPTASATFNVSGGLSDPFAANNTATVILSVNRPPVVDAGPDRDVVVPASPGSVSLSVGYSDPDGDALFLVEWFEGSVKLAQGSPVDVPLTFGAHVIRVVATDARFAQGSDEVTVNVLPGFLPSPGAMSAQTDAAEAFQVVVSWAPVIGASEYRVYRGVDPVTAPAGALGFVLTGNATLVDTVSAAQTSFVDTGLPPLVRQFYAVVAASGGVASRPTPAGSGDAVIVPAEPDAALFGFADTHNHQFANLAFGRSLISGSAFSPLGYQDALTRCELPHGSGGSRDPVELVLSGSLGHDTLGFDPSSSSEFTGWPAFDSHTHQQSYYESVRRAFEGGQRLMVMHAENNELLCRITGHDPQFSCDDMATVPGQLTAAKSLEAFIDSRSGGPGQGWYRIAYSGTEARQIINSGRMAVVLGIEVDELFDCGRNDACTLEDVRTKLDHYYGLGVRHLFPVAHYDNGFGGAALYDPILSFGNFATTGAFFGVRACDAEGYRYTGNSGEQGVVWALLQQLLQLGSQTPVPPDPSFLADCNSRSLTGLGEFLVREMMARGMIIDIDHMSALTANAVLAIAEASSYPAVVSGHSGPISVYAGQKANEGGKAPSQLARIHALGGLSSIFPQQGIRVQPGRSDGVIQYPGGAVANDCDFSSKTLAQAYLAAVDASGGPSNAAIGIGTDFNGLGGQPGPRFGPDQCKGDPSPGPQVNPVVYPFAIAAPPGVDAGRLAMSNMPPRIDNGVSRPWDFNLDGLAHHGMLPDLVEDLRRVGVSSAYLQPLFRSAEAYVSMWENADGSSVPLVMGNLLPLGGGGVFHRAADVGGAEQPVVASFAGIQQEGYLVAQPMENPPPPPSGTIFVGAVLDLLTTAVYTGPVTVCIEGSFESTDALVHFGSQSGSGAWVDITSPADSSSTSICGQTSSLSPFAVTRIVNGAPSANAGTYAPVEAVSPLGAGVTLSGSGSDPDGDALSFLWTAGAVVLGDAASVTASFTIGTHEVTLTVTDVYGASASATSVVVVRDTSAPAVAAPPPLTIPAMTASGTSVASWPELSEWLASATATDAADAAPVGPTAQVNGVAVESTTVFPIGTTTVAFSFRDASGNVGVTSSTIQVVVGNPAIRVRLTASGELPNGDRFVDLTVSNEGTGLAKSVTMIVTAIRTKGSGFPIVRSALPSSLGDLSPGASRTKRVQLTVPSSVKELLLVEIGGFVSVKGAISAFADLQVYKP